MRFLDPTCSFLSGLGNRVVESCLEMGACARIRRRDLSYNVSLRHPREDIAKYVDREEMKVQS